MQPTRLTEGSDGLPPSRPRPAPGSVIPSPPRPLARQAPDGSRIARLEVRRGPSTVRAMKFVAAFAVTVLLTGLLGLGLGLAAHGHGLWLLILGFGAFLGLFIRYGCLTH